MDRRDFYFEQLVTQADMDVVFDAAENADHFLQSDNGYVGVVAGQTVAEHFTPPDLTCDVALGVAYDQTGQRIFIDSLQNLDLSVDSNAVSTAVAGGGNEKWLSVFVQFDRATSDPRLDGNGIPLDYVRAESFLFIVDQGAEASAGLPAVYTSVNGETFPLVNGQTLFVSVQDTPAITVTFLTGDFVDISLATAAEVALVIAAAVTSVTVADNGGDVEITTKGTGPSASVLVTGGTAASVFAFPAVAAIGSGGPSRPGLRADAILLADVLLRNGTTQIFDAPDGGGSTGTIDAVTRRQFVFVFSGSKFTLRSGTITGFATDLAQELTNHMLDTGAAHDAAAVEFDNSAIPVEFPLTKVATEVQAALEALTGDVGGLAATNTWTAVNDFDAGVDFNAGFDMKTGLARFQSTGPVTFSGTGAVQFGAALADNDVFIQTWDNSGNTSQEGQMGTHVRSSGLHLEDAGTLAASLPNSQVTTSANQTWLVEALMVGCEIDDATVTLVRKMLVKAEVNGAGTVALTTITDDISDETAADLILEVAVASGVDIAMKATKSGAQDYAVSGYMTATLCKPLLA